MTNDWHSSTWTEIGALLERGVDAALLPVGATEQHGPHLGCGVDAAIAASLCRRVAEQLDVHLLPTLPYGCSIGHSQRWPGTLALSPKTLIDVATDIGGWAYSAGIRRLFMVNAHVTNFAPLRCALEMLRARHDDLMVALINTGELSERVRARHFEDAADWHANEAESSLMLAMAPALARPERFSAADDPDRTGGCVFAHPVNRTSSNGVTGKPSAASIERGAEQLGWMVADLAEQVARGMRESPPLQHSYFK
ncbi:MAG: creatininase family protein [Pseudomonadales bacterium]